jgi:putative redox protein
MQSKRTRFKNSNGQELAAYLDLPVTGKPHSYAIFAHCFTCGKNLKISHYISRALTQHHIAVLRFDFTGLGESEGDFSQADFSSNVDDVVSAARFLEENHEGPKILIGHSLGGTAVLAATHEISSCRAVTIIASPFEPIHIMDHFTREREIIETRGEAEITLGGQQFILKKQFLDDLYATDMHAVIGELKRPLLIIHSPRDATVDIENAARIYQAAHHPKSFISLDNADHLLSRKEDACYAGIMIAVWAGRYLEIGHPPDASAAGGYVVTSTSEEGFYTEVDADGHSIVADEPESAGGTNQGASPYELLSASLGACTGMTLRMYADRKGWPLESVNVRLKHEKIHAEDCENCPESRAMIDVIIREIKLIGDLTESQKERLLEVAARCPVHRTLQEKVAITTRLIK